MTIAMNERKWQDLQVLAAAHPEIKLLVDEIEDLKQQNGKLGLESMARQRYEKLYDEESERYWTARRNNEKLQEEVKQLKDRLEETQENLRDLRESYDRLVYEQT